MAKSHPQTSANPENWGLDRNRSRPFSAALSIPHKVEKQEEKPLEYGNLAAFDGEFGLRCCHRRSILVLGTETGLFISRGPHHPYPDI